jgi:hypothetical protein
MQELEVSWRRALPVAWFLVWLGSMVAYAGSFLIGFVAGFVASSMGYFVDDRDRVIFHLILAGVIFAAALAWWWFVTRLALRKRYKGFRIALVPYENQNAGSSDARFT